MCGKDLGLLHIGSNCGAGSSCGIPNSRNRICNMQEQGCLWLLFPAFRSLPINRVVISSLIEEDVPILTASCYAKVGWNPWEAPILKRKGGRANWRRGGTRKVWEEEKKGDLRSECKVNSLINKNVKHLIWYVITEIFLLNKFWISKHCVIWDDINLTS